MQYQQCSILTIINMPIKMRVAFIPNQNQSSLADSRLHPQIASSVNYSLCHLCVHLGIDYSKLLSIKYHQINNVHSQWFSTQRKHDSQ